jgi:ERCC4-type nuclease
LTFGEVPTVVMELETGDVHLMMDDGALLMIERKDADDFLGSIADGRLFAQAARLAEGRLSEQINGKPITTWPYVVITGKLVSNQAGNVITDRGVTGWTWASIQGAVLSLQEMGVFVMFAHADADFEAACILLGNRSRNDIKVLPARGVEAISQQQAFLMGLPDIGPERAAALLAWGANEPWQVLMGLLDPRLKLPKGIGASTRLGVRRFLKIPDNLTLDMKELDK